MIIHLSCFIGLVTAVDSKFVNTVALLYACNEINLRYYLSSVYSVTIPLHVSDLLVAHYQEITMYICKWYVLYVLVNC
jgi:hypothetical protein